METNLNWFNSYIASDLTNYSIEYRSFKNGDFGDLDRVELEGNHLGVTIDFWSLGWLNIHVLDYNDNTEVMNILLEPQEQEQKRAAFDQLLMLLKRK